MDPIQVEIMRNALLAIAREMRTAVVRTAHSSTVQEAYDFSVAVFEGLRLVAQAEGIASHLGSLPHCVRALFQRFPPEALEAGDIIIMNDPYLGGSHLPDVNIAKPVRIGGLLFLPVVRAHWSDVGGMTPGSISGRATSVFQEGLRIPPAKLYAAGQLNEGLYETILRNVRLHDERAGDMRAQVAACNVAEARLRRLVRRYGQRVMAVAIDDILRVTELRTRAAIGRIPPGEYCYEDYLDSDGVCPDPVRIRVRIVADGEHLTVDFTGSSAMRHGPVNATLSVTTSAVLIALKSLLDPEWPCNDGFFRTLHITGTAGTCLDAQSPAPTGSCTEVLARVIDVVLAALARALPIEAAAGGTGSINHTFIGGSTGPEGQAFVWYEYPTGGRGGTAVAVGCSAVARLNDGDTRDLSIERAEREFPLLCTRYELRSDSGGPGQYRGGLGLRREVRLLAATQSPSFSCLWDRAKIPTYGLSLGLPGALQQVRIRRAGGELWATTPELGAKESSVPMAPGDTLVMLTSGGGGFGDALTADPVAVAADVRAGYVSREMARAACGVALNESGEPDLATTSMLRQALRAARRLLRLETASAPSPGPVRRGQVNPATASALALRSGDWVELVPPVGPPVRVVLEEDGSVAESALRVDTDVLGFLGVDSGARLWVRAADLERLVMQGAQTCSALA